MGVVHDLYGHPSLGRGLSLRGHLEHLNHGELLAPLLSWPPHALHLLLVRLDRILGHPVLPCSDLWSVLEKVKPGTFSPLPSALATTKIYT
jgi:hypothetical protein